MARALQRSIGGVLGLAALLAGCAGVPLSDNLPTGMGGLPAGAPARPETSYQYPAVHDMPPARATSTLTEAEQLKLEKDLQTARDKQEGRPDPAKKVTPATKKKPADANTGQNAGANSGAKGNP